METSAPQPEFEADKKNAKAEADHAAQAEAKGLKDHAADADGKAAGHAEASAPEVAPSMSESAAAPEIKAQADPIESAAPKVSATDEVAKKLPPIGSAVIPFVPKASTGPTDPEPVETSRFYFLRSRGMQAALVAAFVGLGWAAAGSFFGTHSTVQSQGAQKAVAPASQQQASTVLDGSDTKRLTDEIRVLKKELDSMRATLAQNANADEVRSLKRSVDTVKTGLESTKSEVSNSIAQLSSKLDHVQHEPAKLREINDRLDHIEHSASAPLVTASIAPQKEESVKPAQVPLPPAKSASQTPASSPSTVATQQGAAAKQPLVAMTTPSAPADKPQLLTNWVVRDVYHGIALVEGPRGSIEVIPGETIPGAGTVKSIEKRGNGWIVLTSRGLVDSAR